MLKPSACLGGGGGGRCGGGAKRKPMTAKIKHLRSISAVVGGQCGGGSPQRLKSSTNTRFRVARKCAAP